MRSLLCVLFLALTAASAAANADPRITLRFQGTPLRAAVDQALRGTGEQYVVEPDVPDVPITATLSDASPLGAARAIAREAALRNPDIELVKQGPVYVFGLRASEVSRLLPPVNLRVPDAAREPVSLSVLNVPLRSAVALLFRGSSLRCEVDPEIRDVPVTLTVRHVPLVSVLRLLARQGLRGNPGLTYGLHGGAFRVMPRPGR